MKKMKRKTSATPANFSRSNSRLTKRQRHKAMIAAYNKQAFENFKNKLDTMIAELDAKMVAANINPDPTIYDEEEEAAFEAEMKEVQMKLDAKFEKKRRRMSRSGRGRKLMAKRDAKIEAWAERLANDAAHWTD